VNCFASGDVTGNNLIGGLAGFNDGSISNCYASGNILGPDVNDAGQGAEDQTSSATKIIGGPALPDVDAGGLVGGNAGSILNSYSIGFVHRSRGAGGLVGAGNRDRVIGSFWDVERSGQTVSAGGVGRTTLQMQAVTTFLGWGAFDSQGAWTISDGNDYPRLFWENQAGRPIDWAYPAGQGTKTAPYRICTPEELILIGWFPSQWDTCFELAANIDLSAYKGPTFTIGNDMTPFTGVFEGGGHAISGFRYETANPYYAGLFGLVSDPNAQIRNLELIEPSIVTPETRYVGSLVGYLRKGSVIGCAATGGAVLGGWNVGGLVGLSGTFNLAHESHAFVVASRCTSRVIGDGAIGGLVGASDCGSIAECCASGGVNGRRSVGGLVGASGYGIITDCYATGAVTGEQRVGGLTGTHQGSILRCYSAGAVIGQRDVGGFVGEKTPYSSPSTVASFWDADASGLTTSPCGTGLNTAAMRTASTFLDAGWDFVGETTNGAADIWWILEGEDYPRLSWEAP
jgi:hypothetical protein